MKARVAKVKFLEHATLATLETNVNAWLAGAGENELVDIQIRPGGAGHVAYIVYTE